MAIQYQRGQKIVLLTEKMVPGGAALGRLPDGRPVFVKGGAPGEQVEIQLTRIKKDFAEENFLSALTPSVDRVVPFYPSAALAGANWHYLSYPAQMVAKESILRETLSTIGKLADVAIQPIVAADQEWRYRNKIELTFGTDHEGQVALGFHVPGRFDQILPTNDVALFPELIQAIIRAVTNWADQEQLTVYEPRRKQGVLRSLVVRRAQHAHDLLINLVTTPMSELPLTTLLDRLDAIAQTGVIWTENSSLATIVRTDQAHLLEGVDFIDEQFLGVSLRYHVDSFFQTNTAMAEKLAKTLLTRLDAAIFDREQTVVIDGYGGVGTFGLLAANHGFSAISIESHEASSLDAVQNAERLGLANRMTFVHQPMETYLAHDAAQITNTSVLIIDPPRAGLHPKALQAILASPVAHVFYISCNPATLARDLALFAAHPSAFVPTFVQPFDLFPQTPHLETLVELHR